jgi:hypothetical protein
VDGQQGGKKLSRITLSGNPSGTGNFTLASPNSNTDRTLTLPDATGTLFGQGNIVGTVSQSGGVPTGAVIERGSNANGEFVRYADGTLICWRRAITLSFDSATRLVNAITFPSSFAAADALVSVNYAFGDYFITVTTETLMIDSITASTARLVARSNFGYSAGNTRPVDYIAIGRWF